MWLVAYHYGCTKCHSLLKNKLSEFHNKLKKKKTKVIGIGWYLLTIVAEAMLSGTIALSF